MLRPRNFAARSPLLRKGGVHSVSKTRVRNASKQTIDAELVEWEEQQNQQKKDTDLGNTQ